MSDPGPSWPSFFQFHTEIEGKGGWVIGGPKDMLAPLSNCKRFRVRSISLSNMCSVYYFVQYDVILRSFGINKSHSKTICGVQEPCLLA